MSFRGSINFGLRHLHPMPSTLCLPHSLTYCPLPTPISVKIALRHFYRPPSTSIDVDAKLEVRCSTQFCYSKISSDVNLPSISWHPPHDQSWFDRPFEAIASYGWIQHTEIPTLSF